MNKTKQIEFGDFQTPPDLTFDIVTFLANCGVSPDVIIEPTCGTGSFVLTAMEIFPLAKIIYGFDINSDYIKETQEKIRYQSETIVNLESRDFFTIEWGNFIKTLTGSILILGNPPWVTNSVLATMGSDNLPIKTNFQGYKGFAAKTGKANFDISEWMLIRMIEALNHRDGYIAMLCKTSTARKTLRHAWINKLKVTGCSLHLIDTCKYFGASVDACLFLLHTGIMNPIASAAVYSNLSFDNRISTFGLVGNEMVADLDEYLLFRDIDGTSYYTWRSGVKHDAAKIMEFTRNDAYYINGTGEKCQLEDTYMFPLLKSSDVANSRISPKKYVLLTQRNPSDDTLSIRTVAPKTWSYLVKHKDKLDSRQSMIYKKRPRFSVFGIGDYSFSPWKVAISGLYKNCRFEVIGEYQGKPIILDDTCYFIPCVTEKEAHFICALLDSEACQRFLHSLVFSDAKRPITIDILSRIDLKRVAEHVDRSIEASKLLTNARRFENKQLLMVFEKKAGYKAKSSKRLTKLSN